MRERMEATGWVWSRNDQEFRKLDMVVDYWAVHGRYSFRIELGNWQYRRHYGDQTLMLTAAELLEILPRVEEQAAAIRTIIRATEGENIER